MTGRAAAAALALVGLAGCVSFGGRSRTFDSTRLTTDGAFSYTKEAHRAELGALELTVRDRGTVNIPVWVGVGAV